MSGKSKSKQNPSNLRARAEKLLGNSSKIPGDAVGARMFHDLEVRLCPNGLECGMMALDVTRRVKDQQGMHDSEVRYRRLFEAAQDGILIIDPSTRKIIDANPFISRLLGYTRDQMIDKEQSSLLKQSRLQQKQLRNFSHRILDVQEEERKRISRELHDVIAQTLVGINVHLSVLDQDKGASMESFHEQISNTRELVEKAIKTIHDFARELRPTMLDDLGLIPALEMHMERFNADTGIRANLNGSVNLDKSTPAVLTALYRIALGALTNVARHSKASCVDVTIESFGNLIRMTIKDDGQGFKVIKKSASRKRNRLGLISMKERAEMIGGTFKIDSAPGSPTTVLVEIPIS